MFLTINKEFTVAAMAGNKISYFGISAFGYFVVISMMMSCHCFVVVPSKSFITGGKFVHRNYNLYAASTDATNEQSTPVISGLLPPWLPSFLTAATGGMNF